MQQPMLNPKDILDPTTAIDMALVLMDKEFKVNNTTPTNNNQRSSLNPRNRQIAQPGMNMDQDRLMLMVEDNVGNKFRPYAEPECRKSDWVQCSAECRELGISNQNGKGNVVLARAEGACEEIEEVNANCTLMKNLQQASISDTQTDKAPVYDSDGSTENNSNVIFADSSMDHSRGIVE
ncbi:hypothetical protein Tco_1187558 [Tanacetum coccineum]